MKFIWTRADELSLLGKPMDEEDLTYQILVGLGDEYKSIVYAVSACETSIMFDELHEKLLNKEASLNSAHVSPLSTSIIANLSTQRHK